MKNDDENDATLSLWVEDLKVIIAFGDNAFRMDADEAAKLCEGLQDAVASIREKIN